MWKCVIDSNELKTYECKTKKLQVCIEARNSNNFWEIYKTYHSDKLTFTEEFEATSSDEADKIIAKIKKDILDEAALKDMDSLRKNLVVNIKRLYKEGDVEKWQFSVNNAKADNIIIARYSIKVIELDIITSEEYKFVESELLDEISKILGLEDFENEIVQNIYFFSKRSSFYNESNPKDTIGKIEVGFNIESDKDLFPEDN